MSTSCSDLLQCVCRRFLSPTRCSRRGGRSLLNVGVFRLAALRTTWSTSWRRRRRRRRILSVVDGGVGGFDARDGNGFIPASGNSDFKVDVVARDDSERPSIWRSEGGLDASASDEHMGARLQIGGDVH